MTDRWIFHIGLQWRITGPRGHLGTITGRRGRHRMITGHPGHLGTITGHHGRHGMITTIQNTITTIPLQLALLLQLQC